MMTSTPCISYKYTCTFASILFNYKQALYCLDIEQVQRNSIKWSCFLLFDYGPVSHIIMGDIDIVQNENLLSWILKCSKF
jgi:beta-lactamase superfamily II metal-dependent hydrolase